MTISPTGRLPRDPLPWYFRRHDKTRDPAFLDVDFGEIERRVMAHYPPALNIVVVNPPEPRRRSLWARLTSRPWRPWQKTEEGPQHPLWGLVDGDTGYRVGDTLYVSPQGYAALKVATKLAPLA